MSFTILLFILGAVFLFILIVGGLLSLFSVIFGCNDYPYELELARMGL
jgi:hypothetical protein